MKLTTELFNLLSREKPTPSDLLTQSELLIVIYFLLANEGDWYRSYEGLASDIHLSVPTLFRSMAKLQDMNLMEITSVKGSYNGKKDRQVNHYRLRENRLQEILNEFHTVSLPEKGFDTDLSEDCVDKDIDEFDSEPLQDSEAELVAIQDHIQDTEPPMGCADPPEIPTEEVLGYPWFSETFERICKSKITPVFPDLTLSQYQVSKLNKWLENRLSKIEYIGSTKHQKESEKDIVRQIQQIIDKWIFIRASYIGRANNMPEKPDFRFVVDHIEQLFNWLLEQNQESLEDVLKSVGIWKDILLQPAQMQ
jgi:hypothetical protein